jgi:ABC-type multidrug transport system fused ATPase/permease subunit
VLQFFDILKTKNSLPDGTTPLPDVPPSLADKLAAATAATAAATSNDHNGSSSHSSSSHAAAAAAAAAAAVNGSSADKQSLVEAALLLDQQQHPQHQRLLQQQHHNLGSADPDGLYGRAPDPTLSISGLGLEVELDDVVFGYHPERQVGLLTIPHHSNTKRGLDLNAASTTEFGQQLHACQDTIIYNCHALHVRLHVLEFVVVEYVLFGAKLAVYIDVHASNNKLLRLICPQVLKGVSFKVLPGESVAVVGPSGSGKSTILKLATRLYDAGSGIVKVSKLTSVQFPRQLETVLAVARQLF